MPPPDAEAAARSARLESLIRGHITREGPISLARYMELALYEPGLGYYVAGAPPFGSGGDFVTAPELTPLFARTVGLACAEVLAQMGGGELLEVGAGSGAMAADLLLELERREALPARYGILELSPVLRRRQRETIERRVPRLLPRVVWMEEPPAVLEGVVVANELLDAMPVHRVRVARDGVEELCVSDGAKGLEWCSGPPSSKGLQEVLGALARAPLDPLPPGYTTEVGLAQPSWIRTMGERLGRGMLLLLDYGYGRRELYHPERFEGTLACHYRQRRHHDPLILPGLQDITAHVDFTAVAEAGAEVGLQVLGYTTQGHFLVAAGLLDLLAETPPEPDAGYLAQAEAVKQLLLPGEMGESVKVMGLGRGLGAPLKGFGGVDLRSRL